MPDAKCNPGKMENRLSVPLEMIDKAVVKKREPLGGPLNYYYREAA